MAATDTIAGSRLLRCAGVVLVAGFLIFSLHAAAGLGGASSDAFFDTWLYNALMLGAAGSCFARALLVERERRAWAVMGLGLTAWAAGEIYYSLAYSSSGSVPIPSPADACYLAFYPIAYVALVMLLRSRARGFSAAQWLDGLIAGSALAALAAELALGPIVAASTSGGTLAVATNLAYPIADLTLLTLVLIACAFTGWRPGRAWTALGGGLLILAASDVLYLLQSAQGTYVEGGPLDIAWLLGALLIAAAAWSPLGPRRPAEPRGLRIAAIPAAAALVAIAVQFSDQFRSVPGIAEALSLFTLLCVVVRLALSFRENQALLAKSLEDSLSDALTGLGNRRRLMNDLARRTAAPPPPGELRLLVLFDLNGFKAYNDAFGHPAGDVLLARLGARLRAFAGERGVGYRLGGDEFCLLAECGAAEVDGLVGGATAALSERGEGFAITASRGSVLLPGEASSTEAALQLADRRMYAHKNGERTSAGAQSRDVLVSALREHQPALHAHSVDVARLAGRIAQALEMSAEQRDELVRAAELHDTGKVAIPDAILDKPGPLDAQEWEFMRKHPLIGERIVGSAPALAPVARLVRWSHERWDGSGYPDGLRGEQIPLGARVVAACDAFEAMVSGRPYSASVPPAEALRELRRCAGTQFDPAVVAAFATVVGRDGVMGPETTITPRSAEEPVG